MSPGTLSLPDGRRGQALAVGITLAALLLVWLGAVSPLLAWYQARDAALAQQRALAARMVALEQALPALRAAVAASGAQAAGAQTLLAGQSDAIAGANLQSAVQDLAAQAGTSLDSAAMQPAIQAGPLRRISMQVSVTASWPVLVALLQAVDNASPRMIVDSISLNSTALPGDSESSTIQANISISGFRAGEAP